MRVRCINEDGTSTETTLTPRSVIAHQFREQWGTPQPGERVYWMGLVYEFIADDNAGDS